MKSRLARYKLLVNLLAKFLVLYPIIGIVSAPTSHHEIVPFFGWFLFPIVPNMKTDYALNLKRYGEMNFKNPLLYRDAKGIVPDPESIDLYVNVQRLAKAERNNDDKTVTFIRQLLETKFLAKPCEYELVRVTYNPINYWKEGKKQVALIKTYSNISN